MGDILKAVRYTNLDEAYDVLREISDGDDLGGILDDADEEPQGLLSVIPEDRLPDRKFFQLLDLKKGDLIEVERISYSGYGPPADEHDYMGFISENLAYVLPGRRLPIEIENCSHGARDFHHLDALVLDGVHPINREYVARKYGLSDDWTFDDLFELIRDGKATAGEIDKILHQGIQ